MATYLMAYAVYNPDNYFGHRLKEIQADSFEEAERKGWEYLNKLNGKGKWEYIISECPGSYRIYDTKRQIRL